MYKLGLQVWSVCLYHNIFFLSSLSVFTKISIFRNLDIHRLYTMDENKCKTAKNTKMHEFVNFFFKNLEKKVRMRNTLTSLIEHLMTAIWRDSRHPDTVFVISNGVIQMVTRPTSTSLKTTWRRCSRMKTRMRLTTLLPMLP